MLRVDVGGGEGEGGGRMRVRGGCMVCVGVEVRVHGRGLLVLERREGVRRT